jgi:uncharacterized protein YndB with AHSA1/START domain
MARNEISIAAPPERVFELLSDPDTYAEWVPGTRAIGMIDGDWPADGSSFEYVAGLPGLALRDRTTVRRSRPPEMLELHIRVWPFAPARVLIELEREGDGTRVGLTEEPAHAAFRMLIGPLGHLIIRLRNVETLRRLKRLAEARA